MDGSTELFPVSDIRADGGTQSRSQISLLVVEEFADAMNDGAVFDPVDVVYDGTNYWLWDGFHRLAATKRVGRSEIAARVTPGTLLDAQWLSYGANKKPIRPRTNEEKRRAVEAALKHPRFLEEYETYGKLNFSKVARHVGVHHQTVANRWYELHPKNEIELSENSESCENINFQKTVKVKGSVNGGMDTSNIGVKQETKPKQSDGSEPQVKYCPHCGNRQKIYVSHTGTQQCAACDNDYLASNWMAKPFPKNELTPREKQVRDKLTALAKSQPVTPPPKPYAPQHSTASTFEQAVPAPAMTLVSTQSDDDIAPSFASLEEALDAYVHPVDGGWPGQYWIECIPGFTIIQDSNTGDKYGGQISICRTSDLYAWLEDYNQQPDSEERWELACALPEWDEVWTVEDVVNTVKSNFSPAQVAEIAGRLDPTNDQ